MLQQRKSPGASDAVVAYSQANRSVADTSYLQDYQAVRRSFTGEAARGELGSGSGDDLNMARVAVDRQVEIGRGAKLSARFIDRA